MLSALLTNTAGYTHDPAPSIVIHRHRVGTVTRGRQAAVLVEVCVSWRRLVGLASCSNSGMTERELWDGDGRAVCVEAGEEEGIRGSSEDGEQRSELVKHYLVSFVPASTSSPSYTRRGSSAAKTGNPPCRPGGVPRSVVI